MNNIQFHLGKKKLHVRIVTETLKKTRVSVVRFAPTAYLRGKTRARSLSCPLHSFLPPDLHTLATTLML